MATRLLKIIRIQPLVIIFFQLCTYPYVIHILLNLPSERVMGIIAFLVIGIMYIIAIGKSKRNLPSSIHSLMILQSLSWFLYFSYFNDTSYLVRIFFIFLSFLSISLLYKTSNLINFSKYYNFILCVQSCLGVVAFFLVYFKFLHPVFIHYYSDYRYLNYYILTCSNAVYGNFIRVGGFFDEPGTLAFWGVFALIINKNFIDNRIIELSLIFSLLFTFSAAYFILLPLYCLFFYFNKIKKVFIYLLLLIPFLWISYYTLSDDTTFLHYTTERFEGGEVKSSRYALADHTKEIFYQSPIIGIGAQNLKEDVLTTDNPYEILAKDGILGFVITYLPLIYILIKFYHKKEIVFSIILLFLDYMQRPFHINEMHYLMLYLFCTLTILYFNTKKPKLLFK